MDDKALKWWQKSTYQFVFFILAALSIYVLVEIGQYFKEILIPALIAVFISYLLVKPTNLLNKHVKSRSIAILVVYMVIIGAITIISIYIHPYITSEFSELSKTIGGVDVQNTLTNIENRLINWHIHVPPEFFQTNELLDSIFKYGSRIDYSNFGNIAGGFLVGSLSLIVLTVITLLISFYMLHDGEHIWNLVLLPLSPKVKDHALEIKTRVDRSVHAYIFGQLQLAILTTVVMLITYYALDIQFAMALGALQMLEIIPILGTWVAIIIGMIVTVLVAGPMKALLAFTIYLVYTQIIRDLIVAPKVMGNVLGLHPIGVIVAVMIGAKLAGPLGIIFAPPVAASLLEIFNYFIEHHRLKAKITYHRD